jgi:hypothetical protein
MLDFCWKCLHENSLVVFRVRINRLIKPQSGVIIKPTAYAVGTVANERAPKGRKIISPAHMKIPLSTTTPTSG